MKKDYFVYILTNYEENTFYIGVTSDLVKRMYEHKRKIYKGFSAKYNLTKLVYFEAGSSPLDAIAREKQLKRWHRDWKLNLIREFNPNFDDLSADRIEPETSSG